MFLPRSYGLALAPGEPDLCDGCDDCHEFKMLPDESMNWFNIAELAGSPYREELNKGILMMQESGKMEMLVKKWIGLEGSECAAQQAGLIGWLSSML